jgi:hypothetical protein
VQRVELVLGLVVVAVWIYSLVSCMMTPQARIRGIPKALWLVVIVLLPLLGSVLWLGVGRERGAHRTPRPPRAPRAATGFAAPAAPRGYAALPHEERIRRMEEDLARLERESGPEPTPGEDEGRPEHG